MAKLKTRYVCQACGSVSMRWQGQCPDCAEWNTLVQEAAVESIFKAKHDLSIPLAADTERKVVDAYGVWVEKTMYGKTFMGIERATFLIGADGRIARVWRNVKVEGHAPEVLEAAKAL